MGWLFDYDELLDAIDSYADPIPRSMIPIGDDGGGDLYCLGVTGDDRNKMFFHDHNIGWQADAEVYAARGESIPADLHHQTVDLIGDSFESFILGLSSEE